jgi:hypothetical protein
VIRTHADGLLRAGGRREREATCLLRSLYRASATILRLEYKCVRACTKIFRSDCMCLSREHTRLLGACLYRGYALATAVSY